MYICIAVFMFLKMANTLGISHYHLRIVLGERGGLVECYIAMNKPYTKPINTLFILNNWRTRLFTDNSIVVSPFLGFLRVACTFFELVDTWGWIVQQCLQTMQRWKSLMAEPYTTTHATKLVFQLSHRQPLYKVDPDLDLDLQKKRTTDVMKKRTLYQNSLYELKTHFWQVWGCWLQIWQ